MVQVQVVEPKAQLERVQVSVPELVVELVLLQKNQEFGVKFQMLAPLLVRALESALQQQRHLKQ